MTRCAEKGLRGFFMRVLITGSCGQVGSQAVAHFASKGHCVFGIDNDSSRIFLGESNSSVQRFLKESYPDHYQHYCLDLTQRQEVQELFSELSPEIIIHAAGQIFPEVADYDPLRTYDANVRGTHMLLEAIAMLSPKASVVCLSGYEVYGESPNALGLQSQRLRYEFDRSRYPDGVCEMLPMMPGKQSLIGASQWVSEQMCQAFARSYDLKLGIFRLGSVTGSGAKGVRSDSLLEIIRLAVLGKPCSVFLYEDKMVRDVIGFADVLNVFDLFIDAPTKGKIYNVGGGFDNSFSIRELSIRLKKNHGINLKTTLNERARLGEPKCYYTDMRKFKTQYPSYAPNTDIEILMDLYIQFHTKEKAA